MAAAGALEGMKSYLFSRTLTKAPAQGRRARRSDAGAFVRALKQQPGKDILVMSGGNLAASLSTPG